MKQISRAMVAQSGCFKRKFTQNDILNCRYFIKHNYLCYTFTGWYSGKIEFKKTIIKHH